MATVFWTDRSIKSLDAIVDRIALDNPVAAEGVRTFVIAMGNLLDTFPEARGRLLVGGVVREIIEQKWKRYAIRYSIEPDDIVVIVDVGRLRPFPPRYFVP